jgi:hypothetical protein
VRNISIIDRYYPPNPAISGEMACDMATHIIQSFPDVKVTAHYVDVSYLGGGSQMRVAGGLSSFRPLYAGRKKMPRLMSSLYEGHKLAANGLKGADLLIALSDPPLLCYWASLLSARKKVPWIYYCMDCYPDVFVAGDLLSRTNPICTYIKRSMSENPPGLLIALGKGQAGLIQSGFDAAIQHVILPCGVHDEEMAVQSPAWKEDDGKIYFGYIGNLGEAHSADFITDFINILDGGKHKLILSVYGSKARETLCAVKGHPAVAIVDSLKREELHYIDVHLVSLLPSWTHVSVPSKAVSAVCAESAIIFNGKRDVDTWQMLGEAGWIVEEFSDRQVRRSVIHSILSEISDSPVLRNKKEAAGIIKKKLLDMYNTSYDSIIGWINDRVCV